MGLCKHSIDRCSWVIDWSEAAADLAVLSEIDRIDALDASFTIFFDVCEALVYAAEGTSWMDRAREGRFVISFEAYPGLFKVLRVRKDDNPLNGLPLGGFVVRRDGCTRALRFRGRKGDPACSRPVAPILGFCAICAAIAETERGVRLGVRAGADSLGDRGPRSTVDATGRLTGEYGGAIDATVANIFGVYNMIDVPVVGPPASAGSTAQAGSRLRRVLALGDDGLGGGNVGTTAGVLNGIDATGFNVGDIDRVAPVAATTCSAVSDFGDHADDGIMGLATVGKAGQPWSP